MSDLPRLSYTVREVAESLGVSQWTVYRWVNTGVLGKLPHTGSVRIAKVELDRFLASGMVTGEAS